MDLQNINVSAKELGALLGLTDRRCRQLADEGVFPRAGRGQYPLRDCLVAYIATIEAASEPDELRRERLALMRAQRRRLELENGRSEATAQDLNMAEGVANAFSIYWLLHLRPVATWLFGELDRRGYGTDARAIAGELQSWIIGLRYQGDTETKAALAEARRRGVTIKTYDDIKRLAGNKPSDSETEAAE